MTTTTRTRNDEANCIGVSPVFFEDPLWYSVGLDSCNTCPARLWCLQLVDPANNWSDGVIGGHVWANGKPVESATTFTDPILGIYLKANNHVKTANRQASRANREPDDLIIEGFIAGQVHWSKLTRTERQIAAGRMHRAGVGYHEIMERTRLNGHGMRAALDGDQS